MQSTTDALSTFLLKHPTGDFARGELQFAPVLPVAAIVALLLLGALVTALSVARLQLPRKRDLVIPATLRLAVLALLATMLMRPQLVLSRAIEQRNVVAVVVDDSRSMQVGDVEGGSRLAAVQSALGDSSSLIRELSDRFAVRLFGGGTDASLISSTGELSATRSRTDLAGMLDAARNTLADMPVAGIVLVTDGAQNGGGDLEAALQLLGADQIPVHTVAVGQPRFTTDLSVEALQMPQSVLEGGAASGEARLRLRGVGGRTAVMRVTAGGQLSSLDTLQLPQDRELLVVPFTVVPSEVGSQRVTVAVTPLSGEMTTLNNHAEAMLRVRSGPEKVLYIEGQPRPELPFMRRALQGDSSVGLVALIRTAEGKFLRLGVRDSLDLREGFPVRAEDLFQYRAIVLGSIEAAFFTPSQMRLLQDFVAVRGGGLLAIGGAVALTEGDYAGTPLDRVLPLSLEGGPAPASTLRWLDVRPAPGVDHPLAGVPNAGSLTGWDSLPQLSVVNSAATLRPGATTLLEGVAGDGTRHPVLTVHRYGRGRAAVFTPQDSWRWQLNSSLPDDDQTFAIFWRRLMRWAVDGTPDQTSIEALPALVSPGEVVELRARVADSSFVPQDGATVIARIVPPDAATVEVTLQPDLANVGEYVGTYVTRSTGNHRIEAITVLGVDTIAAGAMLVSDPALADPGSMEMNERLLQHIASTTGGQSFAIDDLSALPDALQLTRSGVTALSTTDLWDAPIVFFLILILLTLDWIWRRRKGLA